VSPRSGVTESGDVDSHVSVSPQAGLCDRVTMRFDTESVKLPVIGFKRKSRNPIVTEVAAVPRQQTTL